MKYQDLELVYNREFIASQVGRLGKEINHDYREREIIVVGVLKGAFIFLSDLVRHLTPPVKIDLVQLASYGSSASSSGIVEMRKDINLSIQGKDVLIVEDIVDSGYSLEFLYQRLLSRGPRSLKTCVFLDKKERRAIPFDPNYVGIVVADRFLVGYGLDHDEKYRNLPEIYAVR
ncbi:MAG: hypoxanthine phosphoribosyltransferase [Deltaproteobacteria bacterium]|nr:hypoxanthine phosphoribosyltransferase [Deltaproteobacteria bacterium]